MQIDPYLNFDGDCAEAMRFYQQVLGGELFVMPAEESPEDMGEEWKGRALHAALTIDGQLIMASDTPPGQYQKPQGTFVSLAFDGLDEARRIYDVLSEGGEVFMAFDKTFWAEGFGMFADRYGTPWMVGTRE